MMYYYYDNWFSPFHILGSVFMVIFWVLLVALIFRLVRGGRHGHMMRWDRSQEILKERYAKGEITKEQFEQMRKELQ